MSAATSPTKPDTVTVTVQGPTTDLDKAVAAVVDNIDDEEENDDNNSFHDDEDEEELERSTKKSPNKKNNNSSLHASTTLTSASPSLNTTSISTSERTPSGENKKIKKKKRKQQRKGQHEQIHDENEENFSSSSSTCFFSPSKSRVSKRCLWLSALFPCGLLIGVLITLAALGKLSKIDLTNVNGGWGIFGGGGPMEEDHVAAAACASRTLSELRRLRDKSEEGPYAGLPMTLDIYQQADQCASIPGVLAPSYTPQDICYIITVSDLSLESLRTQNYTWVTTVPYENFVAVGPTADPAQYGSRLIALPGYIYPPVDPPRPDNEWTHIILALKTLYNATSFSHCKWFFLGTDAAWVNPRMVLATIRGLHSTHPLSIGFQWHRMGWSHGVTYSAGLTLWSRAALDNIVPLLKAGPELAPCTNRTDDFILDACGWESGTIPLHSLAVEPIGELGPGGSWSWQQPHHQTSWVAVHTQNPPFHLRLLWQYYTQVYGNASDGFGFGVEDVKPYIV